MISKSKRKQYRKGLTLTEMVISLAIMVVVMSALLPQIAAVNKSWDSRRQGSDALQNGRVLVDHLNRNLAKAVRIVDVSEPAVTNGFLEFEDTAGDVYRYEVSAGNIVQFGLVGSLSDLAGPVGDFQFTCYDDNDLDNALTIAADGVEGIRFVKAAVTMTNSAALGQDKDLVASAYLRTNSAVADASSSISPGVQLNFGDTTGNTPELAQIDSTHFLCAYTGPGDDGWAVVLDIDTDTGIVTAKTPFEYDTQAGISPSLAKIDNEHYLCAYEGPQGDGWAVVLNVDPDTWEITANTPTEFNVSLAAFPSLTKIEDDHYLCVYEGPGGDGWAVILTVDSVTWNITVETSFEYDTDSGGNPAVEKIDDEHYLCVYRGSLYRAYVIVLTVDTTARTVSKEMPFMFDSLGGLFALSKVDSTHYLCAYSGFSDGSARVFRVNTSNWTVIWTPAYQFQTLRPVGRPALVQLKDNSEYMCLFGDTNDHLAGAILNVDTGGAFSITEAWKGELTSYTSFWPDAIKVNDNDYLCVYEDRTNHGWSTVLNVGTELLP